MKKTALLMLLSALVGCSEIVDQVADGGAVSDASIVYDATIVYDAGTADAACKNTTKGVLFGDSIVQNMFNNGKPVLTAAGATVYKGAVAGDGVGEQIGRWMVSSYRGDQTIDWAYVQIGINDDVHGQIGATEIDGELQLFLADMSRTNPRMKVYLSVPDPARGKLEMYVPTPSRYDTWKAMRVNYLARGARADISDNLNNGSDYLKPEFDSGDGLHPNPAADRASAAILATWVTQEFSCAPAM